MLPKIAEEEIVAPAKFRLCPGRLGNYLRFLVHNVVSVVIELALKDFEITCKNLGLPFSMISWHSRHKLPRRLGKRLEAQQHSGTLQPRTCNPQEIRKA
jgi:hypothetical protein